MLDPNDTAHADLRGGVPPWLVDQTRPERRPPTDDRRTDILIVGAGITGSLLAEHMSAKEFKVCVVDRERPGFGSTMASTAMLQWEIDSPLTELAERYDFALAASIYQRSVAAVAGLSDLIERTHIDCAFRRRPSLYIAGGETGAGELLAEHQARQKAGLPGEYLDHARLMSLFEVDREAAIVSPGSAEANPAALAYGLLKRAERYGAKIFADEAVSYDCASRSVGVTLASGRMIEAKAVILATGYVMPDFIDAPLHATASSWAIATPPQDPRLLWRDRALIWEASESYAYARTTSDDRIIIGGEDDSDITDGDERDRLMPEKQEKLLDILKSLWPRAEARAATVWSGAFGETSDGLPLIGPVDRCPGLYAAYGYGGNGITFSFMASRILAAMVEGKRESWHDAFAIERS